MILKKELFPEAFTEGKVDFEALKEVHGKDILPKRQWLWGEKRTMETLKNDELNPEIMRVVFKDSGFKDDVVKTNAVQILKQAGINDVRSL